MAAICAAASAFAAGDGDRLIFKKERPKKDLVHVRDGGGEDFRPLAKLDPFKPFLVTEEEADRNAVGGDLLHVAGASEGEGPRTELQRIALQELILCAIIRKGDRLVALVQSSDGRGYFVEKGMGIGTQGGVVKDVVSEDRETAFGLVSVRKVVVGEPRLTREGEVTEILIEMSLPSGGSKD